jgi:hypothetical protein
MKTELFGDRGQLSLGSVASQYFPDLGSKFLQGIDLGLILNVSGFIFFSHTPNLAVRWIICQKNVAFYTKIVLIQRFNFTAHSLRSLEAQSTQRIFFLFLFADPPKRQADRKGEKK